MAISEPTPPPWSQTSIEIHNDFKLSAGLPENSDQEIKSNLLRYTYALHSEQTSCLSNALGEYFQEDFVNLSLQYWKDIY